MVKYGAMFICDRCGKTKFVQTTGAVTSEDAGWGYHDGNNLCPDCTELYNKMMNTFFAPEVKRPLDLEGTQVPERNCFYVRRPDA